MQRWKNILFNASFALNCLLVFLLIFEKSISVPPWLQVGGRLHPMVLHFPLVLVILYAMAVIIHPPRKTSKDDSYHNIIELVFLLAVFTSVIAALMGLILSKEGGYDSNALQWHKWSGVAVPIFTLVWYAFNKQIQTRKLISVLFSFFALFMVLFTGHQGAGITHGENSVLEPIMVAKEPVISAEEAVVFTHMVKPILTAKCMSCHSSQKAKGELVMETEALLLKGGKNGILWDSTAADLGLLLRRVHLPMEKKEHMPPKGKPQLTEGEIDIIEQWISKGADFTLKVADLSADEPLRQMADLIFTSSESVAYDFEEADASTVNKLNTINRVVTAEALGSPALTVSFYNSSLFKVEQLKELSSIKQQIVSLDLARMPVTDAELKMIGEFVNLRKLNLSFTNISGATLLDLKNLLLLKSLSLAGTKVKANNLHPLKNLPALQHVFIWNTLATANDIDQLNKQNKQLQFLSGFKGDTIVLKLSPPIVLNEEDFINEAIPLKLKHYIQGTVIRFTMDGTEPDSIQSPVFKGNETINSNVLIRAKAYKAGWISSDLVEASFYKNTFTPDTLIYLTKANDKYKDVSGKLLIDRERGETNFQLGKWLGYRENRLECLLQFAKAIPVQSITLSSLVDVNSYIMPAQSIEIWGGENPNGLKLLGRLLPEQPTMLKPTVMKGLECKFNPATVKCIKIIANPVAKLPSWHPGKGDKAWVFVDEVLVN